MSDERTAPARCPECGAFVAPDAEACKRCGALLSRPAAGSGSPTERGGWSSTLATGLETLLVVAILASLIGAIWMMRPEDSTQLAALPGPRPTPTPLPTSTATLTRTPTPPSTATPTVTSTSTPSFYIHTVESGDTLIAIALDYGATLEAILEANDLSEDDLLQIGQELIIPLDAEIDLPTATATRLPSTGFNVITHTIEAGDTLLGIALQYDSTVSDVMEANGLSNPEEILRIGQVLVIPSRASSPTPIPPTPTPTATPTATQRLSPTPAEPTPTPRFALPAPLLLGPPADALLDSEVGLLNWVSIGVLSDDIWYVVRLRTARPGEPEVTREAWVKATAWRIPEDLAPETGTTQRYRWDVTVMRRIGEDAGEALSPRSEIRTFRWQRK
ncbi:MAG: LysM peptidoglycan-binding domain-containing protein [Anaerolineae bacterium]